MDLGCSREGTVHRRQHAAKAARGHHCRPGFCLLAAWRAALRGPGCVLPPYSRVASRASVLACSRRWRARVALLVLQAGVHVGIPSGNPQSPSFDSSTPCSLHSRRATRLSVWQGGGSTTGRSLRCRGTERRGGVCRASSFGRRATPRACSTGRVLCKGEGGEWPSRSRRKPVSLTTPSVPLLRLLQSTAPACALA